MSDIDISYINNYFVPIIYFFKDIAVADCNIDLFSQSDISYNYQIDNSVCFNFVQQYTDSSISLFFAVCQKAVYIYPNNNKTNISNFQNCLITYCINIFCKTLLQQIINQTALVYRETFKQNSSSEHNTRKFVFLLISEFKRQLYYLFLLLLAPR